MLAAMGAAVSRTSEVEAAVVGPATLAPLDLRIPGDPSSAAFLVAAALLVPGSSLVLRSVSLNPGRMGMFALLKNAGADITWEQTGLAGGEPVGDIRARHSSWGPLTAGGAEVPSMIDEIPLLALLATRAAGRTEISGAGELRAKESDRLAETAAGLRSLGAVVEERPDGLAVEGPIDLRAPSAPMDSRGDHRLAMTWALGGLVCRGELSVAGMGAAAVSYPGFLSDLGRLTGVGQ
jgi:3-phosphoshikimate 1-carboxyvinyltransferase